MTFETAQQEARQAFHQTVSHFDVLTDGQDPVEPWVRDFITEVEKELAEDDFENEPHEVFSGPERKARLEASLDEAKTWLTTRGTG